MGVGPGDAVVEGIGDTDASDVAGGAGVEAKMFLPSWTMAGWMIPVTCSEPGLRGGSVGGGVGMIDWLGTVMGPERCQVLPLSVLRSTQTAQAE